MDNSNNTPLPPAIDADHLPIASAVEISERRAQERHERMVAKCTKAAHARWGSDTPREPRAILTCTATLLAEFQATFPKTARRAAADFGLRYAIDHASEVLGIIS